MLAAYAIPSISVSAKFDCRACSPCLLTTRSTIERPIGSIITAVAVLLTHMLIIAVATMKPAIRFTGLVPSARMMLSAMRRCRPQR